MRDFALGELGLSRSDLRCITLAEYYLKCYAKQQEDKNRWRHTRLLAGAFTGTDARKILYLPGDYDHVPKANKEDAEKTLRKTGVYEQLMKLQNGRSR